jgi:hypothetical protein
MSAKPLLSYTTADLQRLIPGATYGRIVSAIRAKKVNPHRHSSGHWAWTEDDVQALAQALATDRRRRECRRAEEVVDA